MSTLTPREPAPPSRMHNALSSGATMLGIVAIMWILEGIDVVLGNSPTAFTASLALLY